MKIPPAYFELIRQKAAKRWDQLEQDPELAGPWHQLFKQVQSPRHILSELLQNADDAGATEAVVRIEGMMFIFEHNGTDFEDEHFASLCRFGYSNKRALHTIGFRGIGFKSTFSLGDLVQLFTPTLSVGFHRKRFSEPLWLHTEVETGRLTRIQVEISDTHRLREVEKNLEEWLKSPTSLLFFKNIRRMQIGTKEVHWSGAGIGPVPASEWMQLGKNDSPPFLHILSNAEAFPEDALEEIRQERMLGNDDSIDFPPCRVEIVVGAKGRLFVVLPTGVETGLPFACNAPFIQDPARLKIKDPEISPTNRWLLERAGKLAASAMSHWLEQSDVALNARSDAYDLLPRAAQELDTLDSLCNSIVYQAFTKFVADKKLLLTEDGNLVWPKQCINVPAVILEIWRPEQVLNSLDPSNRPLLCQYVRPVNRQKLSQLGWITEIDKEKLLDVLRKTNLPKPDSWRQLLKLWVYVSLEITGYRFRGDDIKIVPVQGREVLFAAKDVIRLGDKRLLQSENDWEFLSKFLIVMNQNWTKFLADQSRENEESKNLAAKKGLDAAYAVLTQNGLQDASDASKLVDQVAATLFSSQGIRLEACVQLAQIAAKLGVSIGSEFRFATRDRKLKSVQGTILVDEDGLLEDFLVPDISDALLLHPHYSSAFKSCSQDEWQRWIANGRTGLQTFIPVAQKRLDILGKPKIETEALYRGLTDKLNYHYVTHQFAVEDWDFDAAYWNHWNAVAVDDNLFWAKLVERILGQKEAYWLKAKTARLLHVASTGSTKAMTFKPVTPAWILRLRSLPCLFDTRGFPRKPDELLRRSPETESLMDVELFVHGRMDREANRPLLDLLGVRSTPTGPDRLLDCLRALASSNKPPVHEVEKWYRRLDQMVDSGSTEDFQKIKQAFQSEKLILTQDGVWVDSHSVFIFSDEEDVPYAAVIRTAVSDLALWRKVGVVDRPTVDLAVTWLNSLPSGSLLSQDDVRRVRGLLMRHPLRIWDECKHWVNLAGEWVPVIELSYALTLSSLTAWSHLHQWVKKKTADFQRVSDEVTGHTPFSSLPLLSTQLEQRLKKTPDTLEQAVRKDWLKTLGEILCRVELGTEDETARVRSLALAISNVRWLESPGLEIIPYIAGIPAGTAKQADVVWDNEVLYVDRLSKAKLARRVPEEIGKFFNRLDIKAALDYGFERSIVDVREYLEENFTLAVLPATMEEPSQSTEPSVISSPDDLAQPDPGENSQDQLPSTIDEKDHSLVIAGDELIKVEAPGSKEVSGELDSDDEDTVEKNPPPTHPPKPVKRPLIERFALASGFVKHGDDRYIHPSGRWIGRTSGSRFPWESRNASGELLIYYYLKEHCLEREPLQLDAEVWGLIDQRPGTSSLILLNTEDEPVELTGTHLRGMCDEGQVTLYPATYRLVYDHDPK